MAGEADYEIAVTDCQDLVEITRDRLEAIARDVLLYEHVREAELSIALIDGGTMPRLNARYLGHDYDTDVLSFLLDETPGSHAVGLPRGAGKRIEGELLVSTTVASAAARRFAWDVGDEIALYVVHGILHLLGYDDTTEAESRVMQERECWHLARWNLVPPGRGGDP